MRRSSIGRFVLLGCATLLTALASSCESNPGSDGATHFVQCTSDADCSPKEVCGPDQVCVPGRVGAVARVASRDGGTGGARNDGGSDASLAERDAGDAGYIDADNGSRALDGQASVDGASFHVVSVSPSKGASGVLATGVVEATCSADVSAVSLAGDGFTLSGPSSSVAGEVSAKGATATFTPQHRLPLACRETATLAAAVADVGGRPLGAPYAWSFTTADGSYGPEQSIGGPGYSDEMLGLDPPHRIFIAPDGSAFTAWSTRDTAWTRGAAHASRYTAATGWTPFLNFDSWQGRYNGTTPVVAVSDNGDALLVWQHTDTGDGGGSEISIRALRYAGGWQAPVTLEAPSSHDFVDKIAVGADASGGFVAAWEVEGSEAPVHMTHYSPTSGWGTVESAAFTHPDAGVSTHSNGLQVSVNKSGQALVAWAEQINARPPQVVAAERFDPGSGWSGKEVLVETVPSTSFNSVPTAVLGDDGRAVVGWSQPLPGQWVITNAVVRTFDGSWGAPVVLNPSATYGGTSQIDLATDSRGTFIAAWSHQETVGIQVYASRLPAGGTWSDQVLLNTPIGLPDGGFANTGEAGPQLAMSRTGDAVVVLSEYTVNQPTQDTVDVVTYSADTGAWSPPVRLATSVDTVDPPGIDDCGNSAVAWIDITTGSAMVARRAAGGAWVTKPLGKAPSGTFRPLALGVGANGQTIVGYRSADDHDQRATVFE
jgi:hypothetical protein